jgi:hypothetical protein
MTVTVAARLRDDGDIKVNEKVNARLQAKVPP